MFYNPSLESELAKAYQLRCDVQQYILCLEGTISAGRKLGQTAQSLGLQVVVPTMPTEPEEAKDEQPEDAKDEQPEDDKDEQSEDAKDEQSEDAKDEQPEDAEDEQPEDAKDNEPEATEDEQPEDAKDEQPEDAEPEAKPKVSPACMPPNPTLHVRRRLETIEVPEPAVVKEGGSVMFCSSGTGQTTSVRTAPLAPERKEELTDMLEWMIMSGFIHELEGQCLLDVRKLHVLRIMRKWMEGWPLAGADEEVVGQNDYLRELDERRPKRKPEAIPVTPKRRPLKNHRDLREKFDQMMKSYRETKNPAEFGIVARQLNTLNQVGLLQPWELYKAKQLIKQKAA